MGIVRKSGFKKVSKKDDLEFLQIQSEQIAAGKYTPELTRRIKVLTDKYFSPMNRAVRDNLVSIIGKKNNLKSEAEKLMTAFNYYRIATEQPINSVRCFQFLFLNEGLRKMVMEVYTTR